MNAAESDFDLALALEFLDEPALRRIAGRFLAGLADEQTRLQVAVAGLDGATEEDWEALRRRAHSLKTSSAYVGGRRLSTRARALEAAARDRQAATCRNELEGLRTAADDLARALEAWL